MTLFQFNRPRMHVDPLGQVRDESGRVYDIGEAIRALRWVTPLLPSSGSPHQYCVKQRSPAEPWEAVATTIAGSKDAFLAFHRGYQRPNRYWEFEGWRFWRTSAGSGRAVTHMLNRCRLDSDQLRPLEAGPADWAGGPPWLEYGAAWPPGWVNEPGSFRGGGRHGNMVYRRELDYRHDYRCGRCGRRFYWDVLRPCPDCGTLAEETLPTKERMRRP